MVRIRIGNDIPIRWAVTRCGVPEDFAGKSLRLYMRTAYNETEVTDFAVNGNVISWTYPGALQKEIGTYTFTLVENEGLDGMVTVDACDALRLVPCTCSTGCAESVEVTSDIDVPANGRTPVFETGETETLDPGSPATSEVEPSGRDEDGNPVYRLNFGVPEGLPGKTPVFSAGQTVTGEPGTQASAKVDEDGEDDSGNPKYKIELTIPRGDTGKTPVINSAVTVTTLEPGSDATASITPDGQDEQGNPKYALSIGVPQGAKGDKGDIGNTGPSGEAGQKGDSGATFTPSVSDSGDISWTNDSGLPNPETRNIRGPKGDKGDTGATGPQGPQGIQGEIGPQGPKGEPGETQDLTPYQQKVDDTLPTESKTVVGAISEVLEKTGVPAGGYNRSLYEAAGAVFNDETGFWELNGLTDITQKQMDNIYVNTNGFFLTEDSMSAFNGLSIRTNLIRGNDTPNTRSDMTSCARNNSLLEVFRIVRPGREGLLTYPARVTSIGFAFLGDISLREIIGVFYLTDKAATTRAFERCSSLRDVKLHGLSIDISFGDSPKLSYESLKFMVDYAANTTPITITVHPTTYGYLTGSAAPTVEVGGTAEEWTALVTAATTKNISFATTE